MLSVKQVKTFKRDGVLILPGFFSQEEIACVVDKIHRYFKTPIGAEGWRAAICRTPASNFGSHHLLSPLTSKRMSALYRSLHQEITWVGMDDLVIRPGGQSAGGVRGPAHLDFPVAHPIRTLANNVVYYTDVSRGGGEFIYWPGSHYLAWDYFSEHPHDYLAQGELSQDQIFEKIYRRLPMSPAHFVGKRGDLLIWHSLLMHAGSYSALPQTRIATIGRWGIQVQGKNLYNFAMDMWKYWEFSSS